MNHKHLIIWLLASFLITYQTVKIYSGLVESGDAAAAVIQWSYLFTVRLWVIVSLLLVIMFKRVGIISMWLSILTSVVFQYVQLTDALSLIAYVTPLKGFILPVMITWVFYHNRHPVAESINH